MSRVLKAWALTEKTGGRKGKFISLSAAPTWYPIKAALYATRGDAIRFLRNKQEEGQYDIVRVQITITELEDEQYSETPDTND
jgi:hypothetical protein